MKYPPLQFAKDYNTISPLELDDLLETLDDQGFLTDKGQEFKAKFWEMFVKGEETKNLSGLKSADIILVKDCNIDIVVSSDHRNDVLVRIDATINGRPLLKRFLVPGQKSTASCFAPSGSTLSITTEGDVEWEVWGNGQKLSSSADE